MTTSFQFILPFALYMIVLVMIGVYTFRFTKTMEGFHLGGRQLGPGVAGISILFSGSSGWIFMGCAGLGYSLGPATWFMLISFMITMLIGYTMFGKRLRNYSGILGSITYPDYFSRRVHARSNGIRLTASLAVLVFMSVYVASQYVASAKALGPLFGLNDFYIELSTRDEDGKKKDKFIGSDADWAAATAVLEQVAREEGLDLVLDPGGAAYYGPKISVQCKDAIGRTWQMSTIQYDFNQPERFGLEYTAPDGSHQRPVMIHSAKFGAIERFMGVLIEHYAGAFPAWLSPVQVIGIPVAADFNAYLGAVLDQLRAAGVRVELDDSDDRMQKKIRNATRSKVPFMLIAGADDQAAAAVSFRYRDGTQKNGVPIAEAVAEITAVIAERR